ncbi:hypothetical protein ACQ86E_33860 [Bradyrhizobium betae]|uniref:hypothetical protein n=1 Tax=Bradyrhizobium betae TaxID=244734 RepID=UPI003D66CC9A
MAYSLCALADRMHLSGIHQHNEKNSVSLKEVLTQQRACASRARCEHALRRVLAITDGAVASTSAKTVIAKKLYAASIIPRMRIARDRRDDERRHSSDRAARALREL